MSYLIVKWNRSGKAFLVVTLRLIQSLDQLVVAPPGTQACDAGGGAFRPEGKEGPARTTGPL
jgi:hypothetical protein